MFWDLVGEDGSVTKAPLRIATAEEIGPGRYDVTVRQLVLSSFLSFPSPEKHPEMNHLFLVLSIQVSEFILWFTSECAIVLISECTYIVFFFFDVK